MVLDGADLRRSQRAAQAMLEAVEREAEGGLPQAVGKGYPEWG
ncbi:hypothetical protein PCCS19_20950 [Paenibacillus sp. CCS19]|nr:hypothetical protein PCCS19_20950 [Paenibacillus cellulosilyticus]